MIKSLIAAVLAAVCSAAVSAAPSVDFDKGVDAKGVLAAAKQAAKDDKAAVDAKDLKYRAERDCVTFSFEPAGPEISDRVWLRSTEYEEVCQHTGDPRNGGGTYCHEVPRWTNREAVQVELRNRQKLFPWEREVFEVCLEGRWLDIYSRRVSHDYKAVRSGGNYVLNAGARKPSDPDKNGISAAAPVTQGKGLKVTFDDKWTSYYAGEKTKIKMALKREVEGWFDPTVLEAELEFDAAGSYTVDFGARAAEFKEALKPGKKYYVEWGFSRLGAVSKPTYMKVGDGPTGVFQPASSFMASLLEGDDDGVSTKALPLPGGGLPLPPGGVFRPNPPPPSSRPTTETCTYSHNSGSTCYYNCEKAGLQSHPATGRYPDGSYICAPSIERVLPRGRG